MLAFSDYACCAGYDRDVARSAELGGEVHGIKLRREASHAEQLGLALWETEPSHSRLSVDDYERDNARESASDLPSDPGVNAGGYTVDYSRLARASADGERRLQAEGSG